MSDLIEIYSASHCPHCSAATERIRDWLADVDFELQRHNVLDNIDRAVELGIRQTPALVVNGKLIHQGPMTEKRLQRLFAQQPWRD